MTWLGCISMSCSPLLHLFLFPPLLLAFCHIAAEEMKYEMTFYHTLLFLSPYLYGWHNFQQHLVESKHYDKNSKSHFLVCPYSILAASLLLSIIPTIFTGMTNVVVKTGPLFPLIHPLIFTKGSFALCDWTLRSRPHDRLICIPIVWVVPKAYPVFLLPYSFQMALPPSPPPLPLNLPNDVFSTKFAYLSFVRSLPSSRGKCKKDGWKESDLLKSPFHTVV